MSNPGPFERQSLQTSEANQVSGQSFYPNIENYDEDNFATQQVQDNQQR